MNLLNRYSFLLLGLFLVISGLLFGILVNSNQGSLITLGVVTVMLIWWVLARRGARAPANPDKRLRRARGAGRPAAVYFYSDFSVGCLFARPFSARAEREHKSHFDFIYLQMSHPEVESLAGSLGAKLGEWVLFDGVGRPAGKAARISPSMLAEVMEKAH